MIHVDVPQLMKYCVIVTHTELIPVTHCNPFLTKCRGTNMLHYFTHTHTRGISGCDAVTLHYSTSYKPASGSRGQWGERAVVAAARRAGGHPPVLSGIVFVYY